MYNVGTKLIYHYEEDGKSNIIRGEVIENCKLPGDICVKWETGQIASYDIDWLDENTEMGP
jgi:hypothetical protein